MTLIRVGHLPITDHLVLGITKAKLESGRETFQNAELETKLFAGWNQLADALSKGEINAAFVLAPTAMDLYKSGVKIRLNLLSHKTGSVLIANKRAGITKIEDFANKVVIIPYQLSVHYMLLHKMLSEKGLVPGKDVQLEVMAPGQMPMAIQFDDDGEVGGFIVAEPFGSQAVTEGYGEEFLLSKDLWPDHPCCVLVMSEELTQGAPDAALDFVKSLVHSGKMVVDEVDEATRIGAAFLKQPEEVIKRVLSGDRIKTTALKPVLSDLMAIQDYMHDQMNIMKSKIDMEKFVDMTFAEEAGAS